MGAMNDRSAFAKFAFALDIAVSDPCRTAFVGDFRNFVATDQRIRLLLLGLPTARSLTQQRYLGSCQRQLGTANRLGSDVRHGHY